MKYGYHKPTAYSTPRPYNSVLRFGNGSRTIINKKSYGAEAKPYRNMTLKQYDKFLDEIIAKNRRKNL